MAMVDMTEDENKTHADETGTSDVHRRQRSKNIATALAIVGFCVLVYFVSIIRMSGG